MSEPCARCGEPRESQRHIVRATSWHQYETQLEVDTAFAEAAAVFSGRCVHCVSGNIIGDDEGPVCLQCGWRPSRAPTAADQPVRRVVRTGGRNIT